MGLNLHRPSLLLCTSKEDLKTKAIWDGKEGLSRVKLLYEISGMFQISRKMASSAIDLTKINIFRAHNTLQTKFDS